MRGGSFFFILIVLLELGLSDCAELRIKTLLKGFVVAAKGIHENVPLMGFGPRPVISVSELKLCLRSILSVDEDLPVWFLVRSDL